MATAVASSPSDPSSPPFVWAKDSNNEELDLELKPAQLQAKEEYLDGEADHQGGPLEEPLVLRKLLSDEQIDLILKEAAADGVWPRGLYKQDGTKDRHSAAIREQHDTSGWRSSTPETTTTTTSTIGESTVARSELNEDLLSAPHHFAWNDGHPGVRSVGGWKPVPG
ncbi:unnamed protein product [Cylindrotheca closterium]|uniref:Uncharacterized protein n=1 Tax=Cylindrotheca closterium TaxID=2856 RepID=A0AAD2FFR5_9STRA|nr:unnamed protein product [Cylindrotheca closterium]